MKHVANPVSVQAYVIQEIQPDYNSARPAGKAICSEGKEFDLTPEMLARYHPTPGDYVVVQDDGYVYVNPKGVFERKYAQKSADPIEQEIQAKGLTAPRITPADIEANIAQTHYFTAADGVRGNAVAEGIDDGSTPQLELLTFCVLVLRNGFTVTGESACASPENFDAEIGRKIARQNAISKIWPLMGYELRSKLAGL